MLTLDTPFEIPITEARSVACPATWRESEARSALALGIAVDVVAGETREAARALTCKLLRGVKTKSGQPRAVRVAGCGAVRVALQGAKSGWALTRCKDRCCPHCVRIKSSTESAMLRRWADTRSNPIVFITLTQTKRPAQEESARQAIDRLRGHWRNLVNTKTKRGREIASLAAGGLRAIEITWSQKGWNAKRTHYVKESGWHAHLHILIELRPGVKPGDLFGVIARGWLGLTGASPAAQNFQIATDENYGQVTMYCVKPFDVGVSGARFREVIGAVEGLRANQGWGSWKGWRREVENPRTENKVIVSPVPMDQLVFAALNGAALRWETALQSHVISARQVAVSIATNPDHQVGSPSENDESGASQKAGRRLTTLRELLRPDQVNVDARSGPVHAIGGHRQRHGAAGKLASEPGLGLEQDRGIAMTAHENPSARDNRGLLGGGAEFGELPREARTAVADLPEPASTIGRAPTFLKLRRFVPFVD